MPDSKRRLNVAIYWHLLPYDVLNLVLALNAPQMRKQTLRFYKRESDNTN